MYVYSAIPGLVYSLVQSPLIHGMQGQEFCNRKSVVVHKGDNNKYRVTRVMSENNSSLYVILCRKKANMQDLCYKAKMVCFDMSKV